MQLNVVENAEIEKQITEKKSRKSWQNWKTRNKVYFVRDTHFVQLLMKKQNFNRVHNVNTIVYVPLISRGNEFSNFSTVNTFPSLHVNNSLINDDF